jgi:hypothetical protein
LGLLRTIVLALALPLATSGALPLWAQLVGVAGPHVCHCSIEKHDCVCARCNPGHDDLLLSSESLKSRCGDDEIAFPGKAIVGVLAAPAVVAAAPSERLAAGSPAPEPAPAPARAPPTPPPRSSSFSRTVV